MSVRSPGGEDSLEKEMATHTSILAREILWTEEPGGLQFMGSHGSATECSCSLCFRDRKFYVYFKAIAPPPCRTQEGTSVLSSQEKLVGLIKVKIMKVWVLT